MIRLWLICSVMLFGLAQFYQWLAHVLDLQNLEAFQMSVPLPVMIMAGVGLAIASNSSKQVGLFNPIQNSEELQPEQITVSAEPPQTLQDSPNPPVALPAQPHQSGISFTIEKSNHRSERRPS